MNETYCFACVAEEVARVNGNGGGQVDITNCQPAVTWVPKWEQLQLPQGTAVAAVALPVCARHIAARQEVPLQSATGLITGRQS